MKNYTRILIFQSMLAITFNAYSQDVFKTANIGLGNPKPLSKLEVDGSFGETTTAISSAITLDITYGIVLVAPVTAYTVTLPLASSAKLRVYTIVYNGTAGGNTITIQASGSDNILSDAKSSTTYSLTGGAITIQSDGTNWHVNVASPPVDGTAGGVFYGTGVGSTFSSAGSAGQVLTSNGTGAPTWVTPTSVNVWNLTGNTGTTYGTDFIGTNDDQGLMFKVNSIIAGRIEENNPVHNLYSNTSFGDSALNSNTIGGNDAALGYRALTANTTGSNNTAVGVNASGFNTTGSNNAAVGNTALQYNNGSDNSAFGAYTLRDNTNGSNNVAFGYNALTSVYGNGNGSQNTAVGSNSLYQTQSASGKQNTAIGDSALNGNTTGAQNTALGYNANVNSGSLINATAIGANSVAPVSNSITLGNTAITSVYLPGYQSAGSLLYTSANSGLVASTGIGSSGQVLQSNGTGAPTWVTLSTANAWQLTGNAISYTPSASPTTYLGTTSGGGAGFQFGVQGVNAGRVEAGSLYNTALGYQALNPLTTGTYNIAIGFQALSPNTSGSYNSALGYTALFSNTTGNQNAAFGSSALNFNTTGSYNAAFGEGAMGYNSTSSNNVAIGYDAFTSVYPGGGGSQNTAIGSNSLFKTQTASGKQNTAIGDSALYNNTTGAQNTALGYNADVSTDALTNATAIGANAIAPASNSITLGNTAVTGFYLPGYSNSGSLLYTSATNGLIASTSVGSSGQVLTSNGTGAPTWVTQSTSATAWQLTGNTGTTYGTNYIGTDDDQGLMFKVNGTIAGRVEESNSSHALYANTSIGDSALMANTSGQWNAAVGYQALSVNTTGNANSAFGFGSLQANTIGGDNSAFGTNALFQNTSGGNNVGFGNLALFHNSTGGNNSAFGSAALLGSSSGDGAYSDNSAFGSYALENITSGSNNVAVGVEALWENSSSSSNVAVGSSALYTLGDGGSQNTAIGTYSLRYEGDFAAQNTAIGDSALSFYPVWGSQNTALGYNANISVSNLSNVTVIGANATTSVSNSVTLGNTAVTSLYLPGYQAAGSLLYTSATTGLVGATSVGTSGQVLTSNGTGAPTWVTPSNSATAWQLTGNTGTTYGINYIGTNDDQGLMFKVNSIIAGRIEENNPSHYLYSNTSFGDSALNSNTIGGNDAALGYRALTANTTGSNNTAVGVNASGFNTTGSNNAAVGNTALQYNNGSDNSAFGAYTLRSNTNGSNNVAFGYNALTSVYGNGNGSQNTAVGSNSLYQTQSASGKQNTAIGDSALNNNITGGQNTALGYNANVSTGTLTNATAIGANAIVAQSNSIVLGSISGVNGALANTSVGIGTNAPNSTLQLNGSMSIAVKLITSNYTASATDYFIQGNCSGGPITLILPDATTMQGRVYYIDVINASGTNILTITTTGTQVIGTYGTSITLINNYEQEYMVSDGSNWNIISGSKM